MSMNLVYQYIDENGKCVARDDFTFQTPTELTYKVLEASTKENQISIIREYLKTKGWDEDGYYMGKIVKTLENPGIVLGMI